jgi:hypothetical protein
MIPGYTAQPRFTGICSTISNFLNPQTTIAEQVLRYIDLQMPRIKNKTKKGDNSAATLQFNDGTSSGIQVAPAPGGSYFVAFNYQKTLIRYTILGFEPPVLRGEVTVGNQQIVLDPANRGHRCLIRFWSD